MLTQLSPRVARALAAARRSSRRRAAWGSFSQRTVDRRYCGLPFIGGAAWFAQACRLAGGRPSAACWQPGQAPAASAAPAATCYFCAGPIEEATSRCACYA